MPIQSFEIFLRSLQGPGSVDLSSAEDQAEYLFVELMLNLSLINSPINIAVG